MQENNFKIENKEERGYYIDSRDYIRDFCNGTKRYNKITGEKEEYDAERLCISMSFCYTYLKAIKKINYDDVAHYEKRKKAACDISFIGWLFQLIKDWLHNKFYRNKLNLTKKEVKKRRRLDNLKSECQDIIMPNIDQINFDNAEILQ